MTDRELLELAAKSLGIRFYPDGYDEHLPFPCVLEDGFPIEWNPLIDDGDALRLAVRLKMEIIPDPEGDEFASTRRTIVRAAAEVGRGIIQQTIDGLPEDNYYKTRAEAKKIGKGGSMSLPTLPPLKYDDHPTFNQDGIGWSQEEIEAINKYAALAVAAERERCAKICEDLESDGMSWLEAGTCAAAIRNQP
jgi:hypothetical protein